MRHIVIIGLFISTMLNGQQHKIHYLLTTDPEEVKLIDTVLTDFVENDSILLLYNPFQPLVDYYLGITWSFPNKCYTVSLNGGLKPGDVKKFVLLHELGHVLDICFGDLQQYPPMWKDKPIDTRTPWAERPWEQSADKWAMRLWNRYYDKDPPIEVLDMRKMKEMKDCLNIMRNK